MAFVVLILAAETALRLFAPQYGTLYFSQNRTGGHKISYNKHGLRDPQRPLKKSPNTIRVLVLGDSVTWGYGVANDQIFLRVVEKLYNRKGAKKLEMWNWGGMGRTIGNYVHVVHEILAYKPDLVICQINLNDIGDAWENYRAGQRRRPVPRHPLRKLAKQGRADSGAKKKPPTHKPETGKKKDNETKTRPLITSPRQMTMFLRVLIMRTHLGAFLTVQLTKAAYRLGLRKKDPLGRNSHELMAFLDTPAAKHAWKLFLEDLETVTRKLEMAKVKVAWIVFPYRYQIDPHNFWGVDTKKFRVNPQKRLAKAAKKLDVPFLDLTAPFKRALERGPDIYVLLDPNHPNKNGHLVAGKSVYKLIKKLGL